MSEQWEWANRFFDAIQAAIQSVAGVFVRMEVADMDDDMRRVIDYVVRVEGGDIACRIRRNMYLARFRDWTIRSVVPSGATTELDKLRDGFGRWYFYAWATPNDRDLADWMLIDLDAVRRTDILYCDREERMNDDGTGFIYVTRDELADCITAQMPPPPNPLEDDGWEFVQPKQTVQSTLFD